MKWMRQTQWKPDGSRGPTVVASERDFKEDIHVVAYKTRVLVGSGREAVDIEIFEGGEDLFAATVAAMKRAERRLEEEERWRQALMDWAVWGMTMVRPQGVLSVTDPAPLEAAEIEKVLGRAALHRLYRNQRIVVFSKDGRVVRLAAGKVENLSG